MTRLPGRSVLMPEDLDAWLHSIALPLHVLHSLPDASARELPRYRQYGDPHTVTVPTWSKRADVWERVIERLQAPPPAVTDRFVHRDYHPTNLLWIQGGLSGVLDFTNSSYGPAGVDLGHCSINLAQLHGPDVADRFVEIYESVARGAIEIDPYWDLVSLLNVLPGPEGVYWGWRNLGVTHLTAELCWGRLDEFAARRVAALG
jgi:aminoglycoside phosphotransferase (APT) family kinase protein